MKTVKSLVFLVVLLCSLFMININNNVSANNDYFKISTFDDVTYVQLETGSSTYLYEVTVNFTYDNSLYNLVDDDIIIYFKQNVGYNISSPINRSRNTYEIVGLEYVGPNSWELIYKIALNNAIRSSYSVNEIVSNLLEIYIGVVPNEDIYTYQQIDLVYNQNFILLNYSKVNDNIYLTFIMQSDFFSNNPFLTDVNSLYNISNFYVRLLNFDNPNTYYADVWRTYETFDRQEGTIQARLGINKEYFIYYYEQIAQVSEQTFFNTDNFVHVYLPDILNYIKYYVKIGNELYNIGYTDGYSNGYDDGHSNGYDLGYDDGYDYGHLIGYNDGYDLGYSNGYDNGYDAGYDAGYDSALNDEFNIFGYLEALFGDQGLGRLLAIEPLPNVTIGAVLMIPLMFFLVSFIWRWFN